MSSVTDVILVTGLGEDVSIAELNRRFIDITPSRGLPFVKAEPQAGNKHMGCSVYLGGFNFLDIEDLKQVIRECKWKSPHAIRLLVDDEANWSGLVGVVI